MLMKPPSVLYPWRCAEVSGSLESFPCLPSHLYLIFFELLKNSLRATVEHYGEAAEYLPPVSVHLESAGEIYSLAVEKGTILYRIGKKSLSIRSFYPAKMTKLSISGK